MVLQGIDKEMMDKYEIRFGYGATKEFYIHIGVLSLGIYNCRIYDDGTIIRIESKTARILLWKYVFMTQTTIY